MAACLSVLPNRTLALITISQRREITESFDAGQEEIRAAPDRAKSRQSPDFFSNGSLRNGHVKSAILCAEYGITLVSQFMEVRIVGPHIHREFKLADKARAANESRNSPFYTVLGLILGQRRTVSPAAPNHLPPVHVCRGISRIHTPNVRT